MANKEHVKILKQGVDIWNKWREENPDIEPNLIKASLSEANLNRTDLINAKLWAANLLKADLSEANLTGANLIKANISEASLRKANLSGTDLIKANLSGTSFREAILRKANLSEANLKRASLINANLSGADLTGADLRWANLAGARFWRARLREANLSGANLKGASLHGANLSGANLSWADLRWSDLSGAILELTTFVETRLEGTNISNSRIYGISAWNLKLSQKTIQESLVITNKDEPVITVDNLEVAQFIYLLLNNERIRNVIDTIGEKGVLILGRFTEERKALLDAIRDRLRELGFIPMMFDFEKPTKRDFTETIKTLAGLSRFIIADITDPKCFPLEMQAVVPDFMVPLVPIIQEPQKPFAMIQDLQQKCEWVFDVIAYDSKERLIGALESEIVQPAKEMADKLLSKRGETIRMRRLKDDL